VTRSGPDSPHHSPLSGGAIWTVDEDACPWGLQAKHLGKCCGQPGANSSFQTFQPYRSMGTRKSPTGDYRFNRSSLTENSASLGLVEKSGPDFHRLALPNLVKSTIRSIPKYGSGVVWLSQRFERA
jgi:hypothetical protein